MRVQRATNLAVRAVLTCFVCTNLILGYRSNIDSHETGVETWSRKRRKENGGKEGEAGKDESCWTAMD